MEKSEEPIVIDITNGKSIHLVCDAGRFSMIFINSLSHAGCLVPVLVPISEGSGEVSE